MPERADIVVVGAGAAGLFAAIWAGRRARENGSNSRIVALDGARTLGAKILVAGGGRCNVTHHAVDEHDFNGSTPTQIRAVLQRFRVEDTIRFFAERGVALKREETGKLFPVSDRGRDVLGAILGAAHEAGVELRNPWRVEAIERAHAGFVVRAQDDLIQCGRLILATGGKALPRSGSDGAGFALARALGHTTTRRILPALVPITLEEGHPLTELAGVSFEGELEVRAPSGKRLARARGPVLCAHFGLSGPAVLDISRHLGNARRDDPGATLVLSFAPGATSEGVDRSLLASGQRSVARVCREIAALPERLARTIPRLAGLDPDLPAGELRKEQRRTLVLAICECPLPATGDRGFTHAEVTAGGVPLSELTLRTMESRVCPGLHLCGEICDVDGRIGGFNFQWAWASGYIAGNGASDALAVPTSEQPGREGPDG